MVVTNFQLLQTFVPGRRTSTIPHIYPSVLQALGERGYAGCLDVCFQGCRGEAMQDLGYELPRIPIPRTRVNRGLDPSVATTPQAAPTPARPTPPPAPSTHPVA